LLTKLRPGWHQVLASCTFDIGDVYSSTDDLDTNC
jgi:hypothetical protein